MNLVNTTRRLANAARNIAISTASIRYARQNGAPGIQFADFGRKLGFRILRKQTMPGINYVINPVSITRYFEFDFVERALPNLGNRFLDVSSPRLFSLYTAENRSNVSITMLNPDAEDIAQTRVIAAAAGIQGLTSVQDDVSWLETSDEQYDCVWSISVLEHIKDVHDDSSAIRLMYDSLVPGGKLIVTVPVDREFWEEYRLVDHYGTQSGQAEKGSYFFQRYYDQQAIHDRLINALPDADVELAWFGEVTPGWFADYERRWMQYGTTVTADDARSIAKNFREFGEWAAMPGKGVCGIVVSKPS